MIYNGIETNNEIKKKIKSISVETEISLSDIEYHATVLSEYF